METARRNIHATNPRTRAEARRPGRIGSGPAAAESTRLFHGFPNPFNPQTTIPFSLAEAGRVTIRVYNVLGQEVAELVDEGLASGFHRIVWDGRDATGRGVSSGVYLIRLVSGKVSNTKKVLLLKQQAPVSGLFLPFASSPTGSP